MRAERTTVQSDMRHSVLVVLISLLALVLRADEAKDPALVEKGRKLYADNGCRMCHLAEGKGNKAGPHDGVTDKLPADEIRAWLTKPAEMLKTAKKARKIAMPAFEHLNDADKDALVAYLQSLKPHP